MLLQGKLELNWNGIIFVVNISNIITRLTLQKNVPGTRKQENLIDFVDRLTDKIDSRYHTLAVGPLSLIGGRDRAPIPPPLLTESAAWSIG